MFIAMLGCTSKLLSHPKRKSYASHVADKCTWGIPNTEGGLQIQYSSVLWLCDSVIQMPHIRHEIIIAACHLHGNQGSITQYSISRLTSSSEYVCAFKGGLTKPFDGLNLDSMRTSRLINLPQAIISAPISDLPSTRFPMHLSFFVFFKKKNSMA